MQGRAAEDVLYDIPEAARRLSLSVWTVRQYVRYGEIKSVKVGGRRLVPASEIAKICRDGLKLRRDSGVVSEAVAAVTSE